LLTLFILAFTTLCFLIYQVLQITILPFSISDLQITSAVTVAILLGTLGKGAAISSKNYFAGISRFSTGELYYIFFKRGLPLIFIYYFVTYSPHTPSIITLFIYIQLTGLLVYLIAPIYGFFTSQTYQLLPPKKQIHSVNKFAIWSIPNDILNDFYHRIDTILLAFFLSATVVGFYESSVRLTAFLFILPASVKSILTVKISGYATEGKDFRKPLKQTTILVTTFLSIGFITTVLFGKQILTTTLGPQYAPAYYIFVALTFQQLIQSLRIILESTFNGLDYPDKNTKITAITILLNLFLAPFFILTFGGVGMVFSTILAEASRTLVFYYYYKTTILSQYLSKHNIEQ
jgi:O-antigen/teichoic acid export membrane protein